jgi:hypothetical protein
MSEMKSRYTNVVGVIRSAIEKNMQKTFLSKIGDNIIIREEGLSEEMRGLRRDLHFIPRTFGSRHTMVISISSPYGHISYGANTLEKISIDKKEKQRRRAQETSNIQEWHAVIIPIMVSSPETLHARSLEALKKLL